MDLARPVDDAAGAGVAVDAPQGTSSVTPIPLWNWIALGEPASHDSLADASATGEAAPRLASIRTLTRELAGAAAGGGQRQVRTVPERALRDDPWPCEPLHEAGLAGLWPVEWREQRFQ